MIPLFARSRMVLRVSGEFTLWKDADPDPLKEAKAKCAKLQ